MLTLYGSSVSIPANKVRMCANKLNLNYDYIDLNLLEGEHRTEKVMKFLPLGKIPAINDDGFILGESNAINKYLCRKHRSDLYPENLEEQAIVDQWVDFVTTHLYSAYGRVMFNKVLAPKIGLPIDEQSLKDGQKFIARYLPLLEKRLNQSDYLAGNYFTLADINLIATIDPSKMLGIDLSEFPKLIQYQQRLCAEPFYQRVHSSFGEKL